MQEQERHLRENIRQQQQQQLQQQKQQQYIEELNRTHEEELKETEEHYKQQCVTINETYENMLQQYATEIETMIEEREIILENKIQHIEAKCRQCNTKGQVSML